MVYFHVAVTRSFCASRFKSVQICFTDKEHFAKPNQQGKLMLRIELQNKWCIISTTNTPNL